MKLGLAGLVFLLAAGPNPTSQIPASVEAQQHEMKDAYEQNLPRLAAEIKEALENGVYAHTHDQHGHKQVLFSDIRNSKDDDVQMSGFYRAADTVNPQGRPITAIDIDLHIKTEINSYNFSVDAAYNSTKDLWFATPNVNHFTVEVSQPGNPIHELHTYLLDKEQIEILQDIHIIQDGSTPACIEGNALSLLDNKGLKEFVCAKEGPANPALRRIAYNILHLRDDIDAYCKR